jgi:hypothetical protein
MIAIALLDMFINALFVARVVFRTQPWLRPCHLDSWFRPVRRLHSTSGPKPKARGSP